MAIIRITKPCIAGSRLGAKAKILRRVLTDITNELRARGLLDEEEGFIDATFAMRRVEAPTLARQSEERPENHGDRGSSRPTALG
jgi:hypothetical protein